MSLKKIFQEKKETIIGLGIVLSRIVMGVAGITMLSSTAGATERSMVLGQQTMPMAQEATMGLTTKKIVVAGNTSTAELEASSEQIMNSSAMAQEATMGLTTEKIVVAGNASKAELEAISQQIMGSSEMTQEATTGLTTEKIVAPDVVSDVVPDKVSKVELEATSQKLINSLKDDSAKKEKVAQRIEELKNKLAASNKAIVAKQEEIKNLSNQLK
jgi:uncharacterized membrane-anchored protein YjiN (DUF445 family)